MVSNFLIPKYRQLKSLARKDWGSKELTQILADMTLESAAVLSAECRIVELKSCVTDKQYFSYKLGSRLSRPINKALFVTSVLFVK